MALIQTIRAKIVWTFTALVILNLMAGFWSIYNFYSLGSTVSTILGENYQAVLAAENMVKSLERGDNALLVASEVANADTSRRDFTENREYFYHWYDQAVRSVTLPSQEPLRDSIRTAYAMYTLYADSMVARIAQGALGEAKNYYYESVRPISDRLRELCFRLFELNQTAMYNATPRIHMFANQAALGTIVTSLITLFLSIITTVWLTRVFVTPAEKLTDRVREIGAGKLDLKIDVLSDDEIGQLSREFNKMTERLKRFEQMNIDQILSEKRKSEVIVNSIDDGLVVTDASMNIIHMNRVVAELCKFYGASAVGLPVASIIKEERILKLIRASSSDDRPPDQPTMNYLAFDLDDQTRYFRPKLTRIFDSEGRLYGVLTLLQDVTQFKELDRMKSDFIATLSHEFRTPLTSINMSVDILNQEIVGQLNERQKELINATKEDTWRLTKLARELLQLSKLESGRTQLRNEELDVQTAISFALKPLQIQFQEKGIALITKVEDPLPRLVADEQQFTWLMTNLVTNALKYTAQGGSVTVRARDDHGSLLVEVEDTGIGIAPSDLDKIFDKFVQVKKVADAQPGSVGLGLAIAKEIVELYGGRIWVESEPGIGSTFSILLPFREMAVGSEGGTR